MKFIYLMKNESSISPPTEPDIKEHIKPFIPPRPTGLKKYIPKTGKGISNYCELLGLTREPFSMAPDPDFFYHSKQHQECLNRLEISLRLNRGLQVVVGGIGTGKTTISRVLLDRFTDHKGDYTFFLILNPTWRNNREFLIHLKNMFDIRDKSNSVTNMMNQIEHFLIDHNTKYNKRIILIIDEGQKMRSTQLEIIRSLLNFETNSMKLIQFAIFAQPEFLDTLNKMENLKDRITCMFNIHNIDNEDIKGLIDHRLQIADIPDGRELFTENAKNLIYKHTNGFPRKIIVTCHNLLIDMLINSKSKVDTNLVLKFSKQNNLIYE